MTDQKAVLLETEVLVINFTRARFYGLHERVWTVVDQGWKFKNIIVMQRRVVQSSGDVI